MKSFIVSMLCIISLIAAGLFFTDFSERVSNALAEQAETELYLYVNQENWPAADNSFQSLLRAWEHHRLIYMIFTDHEQPYNIDVTLERTQAYIKARSRDQSMGEIMVLKEQFLLLRQSEGISWSNII